MKRFLWAAAALLLAGFDAWCFAEHWSAVAGNTAASVIWTTPALVAHHVLTRRRSDRQAAEQVGRQAALAVQLGSQQQELTAHRTEMAAVAAQVGEIHALHLHGTWPEDRHRDR